MVDLGQKLARLWVRLQPEKFYDQDYFLKDCGGWETFLKSGGKKLVKRFQVALEMVEIKKGMKILDIGCGRGEVVSYYHQKGAKVIGLDFSQAAIKIAKKTYPEVSFIHQNVFQYQPETKFSLIMMLDFIEHIPKRKFKGLLRKCHHWLEKKGQILIHTNEKKQEEAPGVPFHSTHINLMTAQEVKNILNEHGFKIKKFILRPRESEESSGGIYCLAQKG
ncbi:hypothetical protein AMJ51_01165 [Microgenomates bacterium DG_75]|nr:MAG: hypothetical protein AMJ51_01165 [Microgenomates bacterium DG_75]